MTREEQRLADERNRKTYWRRWGCYLSERQWGTVREDYSANGDAWNYFSHDHARSRAYRWGEDGIAGLSDNHQRLCFALALWNGEDSILKERLFGLTGPQGNHGEDCKEYYFYLDSTPTHSYMKMLYKYPQSSYPYKRLIQENSRRGYHDPEFELLDTGIFDNNRYFDVWPEYAKATPEDMLIRIEVSNRSPDTRTIHLLPTLWFRNTWSWGHETIKPAMKAVTHGSSTKIAVIEASHATLGTRRLYCEAPEQLLFTENETNTERLFGVPNASPYVKDGINEYLVHGREQAVNPAQRGTKAAALYRLELAPGQSRHIMLRFTDQAQLTQPFGETFEQTIQVRKREADEFYQRVNPFSESEERRNVQRQAFAGMLWSKQFYHYAVQDWMVGDPGAPPPPEERRRVRNAEWIHVYNDDILSMPDKWEYPWFAAWDTAFHTIPLAMIDPDFAKKQLDLLTREWYMHPNGQIPAYEWNFSDVNPPVHAWAAWRIYKIEKKMYGRADRSFLERVFQKLLLNFTWWVNRKDDEGKNVFQGGFLGLDNIGVFDRSAALPAGGHLHQSDSTSWMAMYCLNMLSIALEVAKENRAYEDIASKFFEHFLYIADAMHGLQPSIWNEEEGFYYDLLHTPQGAFPLKVHSLVGLIPIFAVESLEPDVFSYLPHFTRRLEWFIENRPDLRQNVACMESAGLGKRRLLSIVSKERLRRLLSRMLDEDEFLSPYGIRSVSKFHQDQPYIFEMNGQQHRVEYAPAESTSGMFGGNSNWRGPIWFPLNFLLIESLQKFYHYYGADFTVECPAGSGRMMNLWEVANELSQRLMRIFLPDESGKRPLYRGNEKFQRDPHWKHLLQFYEYFHGDNGSGIGASHQTGWTGLVAKLIEQCGEYCS
ncbi:MAG: glucosidase [bacterium]|nr:glucosidase [bacterium]